MAENTPPLYGRLVLNESLTLAELAKRFEQISQTFLGEQEFGAYLNTKSGKSMYGLALKEVLAYLEENLENTRQVVFSASSKDGKGVRFTLQQQKEGLEGKYFIATGKKEITEQIDEMLQGIWKEREIPEPEPEPAPQAPSQMALMQEPEELPEIKRYKGTFHFDTSTSPQLINKLCNDISVNYLNGAPFNLRVTTLEDELFMDLAPAKLGGLFESLGNVIHSIYLDAGTREGYLVDIRLNYQPTSGRPTADVQILSPNCDEIQEMVIETLKRKALPLPLEAPTFTRFIFVESKRFQPESFSNLILEIAHDYLQRTKAQLILTTRNQKTYHHINVSQFQEAYHKHAEEIHGISVEIRDTIAGHWLFLGIEFQEKPQPAFGFVQIFAGSNKANQKIFDLIESELLINEKESLQFQYLSNKAPLNEIGKSCMAIMPLDAYWFEPLFEFLSGQLKKIGFSIHHLNSLFAKDHLKANLEELHKTQWVIADLTYKSPEVYYFLGIAQSLDKNILLLSQHKRNIPDDFRNFPHIIYNNNVEGLEDLGKQVREIVQS